MSNTIASIQITIKSDSPRTGDLLNDKTMHQESKYANASLYRIAEFAKREIALLHRENPAMYATIDEDPEDSKP